MAERVRASKTSDDDETTLEDAVLLANKHNYLLSTLYQRHPYLKLPITWYAALRPINDFTLAYGEGPTPGGAVMAALRQKKRRLTDAEWEEFKRRPKVERVRSAR